MSARATPDAAPDRVLTFAEITALDQIDASRTRTRLQRRTFAAYLPRIIMLDGYLSRKHGRLPRYNPLARHRLRHLYWIQR
nr:hypothetical protein [Mesorhizobium ciceri]